MKDFRRKLEIPEAFILASGNKKPHKNMRRLVQAWSALASNMPLVLLSEFDPEILHIAQRANKKHLIYFLRFVSDEDLSIVYSLAKVFVFPSLYEGFGLPPLEAAACGVPVVVANRTSLPEVLENAAFYFDPEDVDDIKSVLQRALETDCSELALKGREKALQYSWRKAAEETLKIYRMVLARSNIEKTPQ